MKTTLRALGTSIALAAALALLGGCSGGEAPAADAAKTGPVEGTRVGNLAPDFALQDADGRTVRLSDYRGKVVLVEFSAMW